MNTFFFPLILLHTVASFQYEKMYEPDKIMKENRFFYSFVLRYIHTTITFFGIFYLALFKDKRYDTFVLALSIIIPLLWIVFRGCFISNLEWTNYHVDIQSINNDEIMHLNMISKQYYYMIFVITVIFVLYRSDFKPYVKITYLILYLLFNSMEPPGNYNNINIENIKNNLEIQNLQASIEYNLSSVRRNIHPCRRHVDKS